MGTMPQLMISPGAAARQFGVDPKTVSSWLKSGRLTGVRLPSGRWRVSQEVVDAALIAGLSVGE